MRQSNDVHVVIPMLWFIIIIYAWHDKHISLITNSNAKKHGKTQEEIKDPYSIFHYKEGLIFYIWNVALLSIITHALTS